MRFERLRLRAMGSYRDDVDIDFCALPGPIIAVTGPNGCGKSTLLELLAGALYRQTPTRGTLASLARARDSFAEIKCVNGSAYTIRHTLDAVSGKGEVLVLDVAGNPMLESGKVREFDAWAGSHLSAPSLLYSSSFAIQGQRGFLDLSPSERKQVLVRLLSLERYDVMARQAHERAGECKRQVELAQAKLDEITEPDLDACDAALQEATKARALAHETLQGATAAHARAVAASESNAAAQEITHQRQAVKKRLLAVDEELADLGTRIGNNRRLLEQKSDIDASAQRLAELQVQWEALKVRGAVAGSVFEQCKTQLSAAVAEVKRATRAVLQAREVVTRLEGRVAELPKVREAARQLEGLRARVADLGAKLKELDQASEHQRDMLTTGKDQRISGLRRGLQAVDQAAGDPQFIAHKAIETDDALEREATAAPEQLKTLRAAVAQHKSAEVKLFDHLLVVERFAARLPELAAAEQELQSAYEALASAEAEQRTVGAAADAVTEAFTAAEAEVSTVAREAVGPLSAELSKLAGVPALKQRLDQAQTRIEELTQQQAATQQRRMLAQAELAALPVVTELEPADIQAYDRRRADAQEDLERCAREVALAQRLLEQGQLDLAKRAALTRDGAFAHANLSDWTRLSKDLGRDGLQAMELDAALPAINAMANDLLHHAHGPRFTVELRTDRLSADGKRVIEDLDVRVIDTVEGRDALAETFSGGECVIVGEAIALALTMLACQRSGFEAPTLVRDESGAALDADCAPHYVAMLRRAAQLIGAHRVLFVTHNPELQELADSRITITADHQVLA